MLLALTNQNPIAVLGVPSALIQDFEAGTLKPHSRGRVATLDRLPIPRWSACAPSLSLAGCYHFCEFYSLSRLEGVPYRTRPPREVLDELEAAGWKRLILFAYKNVYVDRGWTLMLLGALADRGFQRPDAVPVPMDIADDDEMQVTVKRGGCMIV